MDGPSPSTEGTNSEGESPRVEPTTEIDEATIDRVTLGSRTTSTAEPAGF